MLERFDSPFLQDGQITIRHRQNEATDRCAIQIAWFSANVSARIPVTIFARIARTDDLRFDDRVSQNRIRPLPVLASDLIECLANVVERVSIER